MCVFPFAPYPLGWGTTESIPCSSRAAQRMCRGSGQAREHWWRARRKGWERGSAGAGVGHRADQGDKPLELHHDECAGDGGGWQARGAAEVVYVLRLASGGEFGQEEGFRVVFGQELA